MQQKMNHCFILKRENLRVTTKETMENLLLIRELDFFLKSKWVSQYVTEKIKKIMENPLPFDWRGTIFAVYDAYIILDICDAILTARNESKERISYYHQKISERAQKLIKAMAQTGIAAIIDELTGYQSHRGPETLKMFMARRII